MNNKYINIFFLIIVAVFFFDGCGGGDQVKSEPTDSILETANPSSTPTLPPFSLLPEHTSAPTPTLAPSSTPESIVYIKVGDFGFILDTVTVLVGTTVIWTYEQGETGFHTVTSEDGIFASEQLGIGDSFSFTFNEPGTYPYYCTFHTNDLEDGVIIVIEE